jgi:hypothetical protein
MKITQHPEWTVSVRRDWGGLPSGSGGLPVGQITVAPIRFRELGHVEYDPGG